MNDDVLTKWKTDPNYRLLQAEVEALDERLESKSEFGRVARELWEKKQVAGGAADEEHLDFYRHVLEQMMLGKFERIVPPGPLTDIDSFGVSLMKLNGVLDQKFAEVRALSGITHEINEGIFIEDVLNHVFDTFRPIIPYDHIGFALLDLGVEKVRIVKAYWARSDFEIVHIKKGGQPQDNTSLKDLAQSGQPRIINDLKAYLEQHPGSISSRLMIKEGMRSSLVGKSRRSENGGTQVHGDDPVERHPRLYVHVRTHGTRARRVGPQHRRRGGTLAGPGEIPISQTTFDADHEHVQVLDQREIEAKGFSDPVRAYTITGAGL